MERLLRRLQLIRFLAFGVIVAAGALAHNSRPAYAVQPQPALGTSYYVRTTNVQTLYDLGCNQGRADYATLQNSEVVLDFGVQWSDNNHTQLTPPDNRLITYAQVISMSEQFAVGYWVCTASDTTTVLRLGIGTNNSTPYESSTLGNGWANVAATVQNWLTTNGYEYYHQEDIWGANDIEPSWGGTNSQTNAKAWADGYSGRGGSNYLNYGSVDGCPPVGQCNNGWSQNGIYYVSWGSPPAYPLPEIYYSISATQWASVSTYARTSLGVWMNFQGPLDEYTLDSRTLKPADAWNALWNALNSAGDSADMTYSCEIHVAT